MVLGKSKDRPKVGRPDRTETVGPRKWTGPVSVQILSGLRQAFGLGPKGCSVFFLRTNYSPEEDLRAKMAAVFAATSFPIVLNGTSLGASRGETASASLSWSSSLRSSIFPLHATPLTRNSGSLNPSHRYPKVYPASFLLFFRKLDF